MLNYSLSKEQSKTFIKYYKEKGDSIVIKYADNSKLVVDNNDNTKKKLNYLEERQIRDYNESEYSDSSELAQFTGACLGLATFGAFAITMIGGVIALFIGGWPAAVSVAKWSTLLYVPATLLPASTFVYKLASLKFNLFLKYKDKINSENEDVVVDENTNNIVTKSKKVKNLCINDINFMNYFQVRKLTNKIKKEELDNTRYHELGITPVKKLVKTNKK